MFPFWIDFSLTTWGQMTAILAAFVSWSIVMLACHRCKT
jgi:hypothetical protein